MVHCDPVGLFLSGTRKKWLLCPETRGSSRHGESPGPGCTRLCFRGISQRCCLVLLELLHFLINPHTPTTPSRNTLCFLWVSGHASWSLVFPVAVESPSASEKHPEYLHTPIPMRWSRYPSLRLLSSYLAGIKQSGARNRGYTRSHHQD